MVRKRGIALAFCENEAERTWSFLVL